MWKLVDKQCIDEGDTNLVDMQFIREKGRSVADMRCINVNERELSDSVYRKVRVIYKYFANGKVWRVGRKN
jgi:predicted nuclease of predicted toxin-antitoxin system